ncbi:MAG: hypothetical protein HFJ08_10405 [Lachnospiraceae bacterium]|jgi:4-hydroxybenzoate polyprenyltransferase|nr:hypothetical protein [Lachnospiraceae bacterium]
MKKLIGYSIICFSMGMLFMIILGETWIGLILIAIFIIIGYNLLQCNC